MFVFVFCRSMYVFADTVTVVSCVLNVHYLYR